MTDAMAAMMPAMNGLQNHVIPSLIGIRLLVDPLSYRTDPTPWPLTGGGLIIPNSAARTGRTHRSEQAGAA
jgi:hypothetical protein